MRALFVGGSEIARLRCMHSADTTTPTALAKELGETPNAVRTWLRSNGMRSDAERWQRWALSKHQADLVRAHFGSTPTGTVQPHSDCGPQTA